jgi:hypothetical protein
VQPLTTVYPSILRGSVTEVSRGSLESLAYICLVVFVRRQPAALHNDPHTLRNVRVVSRGRAHDDIATQSKRQRTYTYSYQRGRCMLSAASVPEVGGRSAYQSLSLCGSHARSITFEQLGDYCNTMHVRIVICRIHVIAP